MPDWIAPTKEPPSSTGPSALAEWKVVDDPDYNRGICIYEVIDLPNLGIRLIAKNLERKDAELIVSLYEAERTRHE